MAVSTAMLNYDESILLSHLDDQDTFDMFRETCRTSVGGVPCIEMNPKALKCLKGALKEP